MITKETAARIWNAYREISTAEKLLEDMKPHQEDFCHDEHAPTLKDAFGRKRDLELGVPCGESGHRLFGVSPKLAVSVIKAHIEYKKAELAEANEQAGIELTNKRTQADLQQKAAASG